MDRFPDGTHVWLRSAVRGAYLSADDDGSGVSLSRCRATMSAVWQVQRVVLRGGTPCIFLQSAAYGRYLALSPFLAPHGHRGRPAILRDYDEPHQRNIRWRAIPAGDGSDDVLLCTLEDKARYLRTHGSLSRACACVTIDSRRSGMARWTGVHIPPRPEPPALPTPSTDMGGRADRKRQIHFMQANDEGRFFRSRTVKLEFSGESVFNLWKEVAKQLDVDMFAITLCVQAGFYGRLTPLVVDLPRSEDPLNLVVLPTSSPRAKALVHPDIPPPGIELLTDGAFVRLSCRVRDQCCYLHAQRDGVGVELSSGPTSLQDVWAVHKIEVDSDEFLMFRSAAYGRYFALTSEGKERGSCFAQVDYQDPNQSDLLWVATSLKGSNEVNLNSGNGDKVLDIPWTVEIVPSSPTSPVLPAPVEDKDPHTGAKPKKRLIWHKQGDDMNAKYPWTSLVFRGKSLSALRSQLSEDNSLILCVRAGRCGQLTPLVTDLPDNDETIEIIMLTPGSPGALNLVYPHIR